MNIQIFGKNKCFETKKAQRYFKERNIKFQFVEINKFGLSKGEYQSVKSAVGGTDALIDASSKEVDIPLTQITILSPFRRLAGTGLLHIALHISYEIIINYNLSRVSFAC